MRTTTVCLIDHIYDRMTSIEPAKRAVIQVRSGRTLLARRLTAWSTAMIMRRRLSDQLGETGVGSTAIIRSHDAPYVPATFDQLVLTQLTRP